jgi:hypothetical protein
MDSTPDWEQELEHVLEVALDLEPEHDLAEVLELDSEPISEMRI